MNRWTGFDQRIKVHWHLIQKNIFGGVVAQKLEKVSLWSKSRQFNSQDQQQKTLVGNPNLPLDP